MKRNRSGIACLVCGNAMEALQACHLRCRNCGAEMTCGDKGAVW